MSLSGARCSSEEWGELVCDVIEGLTKFCFKKNVSEHATV